jgi:hypothetical protein
MSEEEIEKIANLITNKLYERRPDLPRDDHIENLFKSGVIAGLIYSDLMSKKDE